MKSHQNFSAPVDLNDGENLADISETIDTIPARISSGTFLWQQFRGRKHIALGHQALHDSVTVTVDLQRSSS